MFLEPLKDDQYRFARLSPKEREVLDQILLHKSLKVIAHDLGITLSAVDQRLKSARGKLEAVDRNDAARIYSRLLASCRESTCGFAELCEGHDAQVTQTSEPPHGATFTFQDSATIEVVSPWSERSQRGAVSEVLDDNFGRLWRVIAIPVFAVSIAMLALALMAMAKALSELL
jgi:DNA-binding CsgD family transcriptional regulator